MSRTIIRCASFSIKWDADIMSQHMTAKNEMAILTTFLSDVEDALDEDMNSLTGM